MGIIILAVTGGIMGWLAAIIMSTEDIRQITQNVAAGSGSALFAGILVNNGSVIQGLSAGALLFACVASVAAIMALHAVRSKIAV